MPLPNTSTRLLIAALAIVSAIVVAIGMVRDYSFLPDRGADGFLSQLEYIRGLLAAGDWGAFLNNPLMLVHLGRYLVVWPFLTAEQVLGPAASLSLLLLVLWPLIIAFRPQRGDWRDIAYVGLRFAVLMLPLAVSGRTVLAAAGMGYLVFGIMLRPFSGWRIFIGCFAAVLSSASVLFSIAVLAFAGNWPNRSRAFYAAKGFFLIVMVGLFMPSLFAKADGFSSGAPGYSLQAEAGEAVAVEDEIGTGPLEAAQRVVGRSTIVESHREGNIARLVLYFGLFAAAWSYIIWSAAIRRWHPLLVVLVILSSGIMLEGLALWPILFPLIWAYTGTIRTDRSAGAP